MLGQCMHYVNQDLHPPSLRIFSDGELQGRVLSELLGAIGFKLFSLHNPSMAGNCFTDLLRLSMNICK